MDYAKDRRGLASPLGSAGLRQFTPATVERKAPADVPVRVSQGGAAVRAGHPATRNAAAQAADAEDFSLARSSCQNIVGVLVIGRGATARNDARLEHAKRKEHLYDVVP